MQTIYNIFSYRSFVFIINCHLLCLYESSVMRQVRLMDVSSMSCDLNVL